MKHLLFPTCILFVAYSACCQNATLPAGHPPLKESSKSGVGSPSSGGESIRFSGKAIEATNAGAYTYILVDTGKEKLWTAATQCAVKPGDEIVVADAMEMPAFHSKMLDRDFDKVYFTGSITINGALPSVPAAPEGKSAELPKNHPPLTGSAAPTTIDPTGIQKAKGGKTIEEIYAAKTKLNGQQVTIRGKVVKYNANILGKNWLHLRDGTGGAGSNDLLITTSAPSKVGDTVLAVGSISLKKDFGSNYKYDLMIENAKITIE